MMRRSLAVGVALVVAWLTLLPLVTALSLVIRPASAAPSWWHPGPLTSWQYDLEWPVAVPTNIGPVQVYDIDYDGSEQGTEAQVTAVVSRIHAEGDHAICYLETGAWENYRPDASAYPASVLGNTVGGYPDERYVDIRQWSVLEPILEARFRQCKAEGFDGVETDIDDSYTDVTGFPLTLQDEVTFDTEVANDIHALGLAWFLKNGVNGDAFITDIEPLADGTVNEQCWQYQECSQLGPFAKAGKPVLNVEYQDLSPTSTCPQARAFPMATMHTDVNLDGTIAWSCWAHGGSTSSPSTTVLSAPTRRPPTFTSASRVTAVAGHAFTFRVATSGYPMARLSHSTLPRGLRWAPSADGGGVISGKANAAAMGPTRVSLTAVNTQGSSTQVLMITVAAAPTITSGASMRARDGAAVSFTVRASGYPRPVLSHTTLPAGLTWARNGAGSALISGRPNAAAVGAHRVVITAKNAFGTVRQVFTITVS
jgi:hypothetical protein